jgi:hypothetical protein
MIVQLVTGIQPPPGLTPGISYSVLALYVYEDARIELRITTDEGFLPALYKFDMFQIVDGSVPMGWEIIRRRSGGMEITPPQWARLGFWEDFFDGEPEAVETFNRIVSSSFPKFG